MMVLGQYRMVLVGIWWYWVSMGSTGWYLVILGQYNLVLFGISGTGLIKGFCASIS